MTQGSASVRRKAEEAVRAKLGYRLAKAIRKCQVRGGVDKIPGMRGNLRALMGLCGNARVAGHLFGEAKLLLNQKG